MTIETIIKIYNATLENRNIKAEDLIIGSAKAANFTDEGIRKLIEQYNKTIREATERAEAEGKDVIDCLKEVENKIEIEEKLPNNLSGGQKKQEIDFPDAEVNTSEAKEPPKDNVAFEDEDKYDLSVDDGTEDNINFPDAKVNTGEAKESPKNNIDFKDKPINDTKTGDFQFGDESTEGAKYLTNNEEFDSLDIDDGNDNTPPDEGNDNTPPSGPALK